MIHKIVTSRASSVATFVSFTAFITIGGIISFQRMPVDAYPDLASN